MGALSTRRLHKRILCGLEKYIDNWNPKHIEDSSVAVRNKLVKAHDLLQNLTDVSDKRVEQFYHDIKNELSSFGIFYEATRKIDDLIDGSTTICDLVQKCVKIINSKPDKSAAAARPPKAPWYWTKRIIISAAISLVMSMIVIPNLNSYRANPNTLTPPLLTPYIYEDSEQPKQAEPEATAPQVIQTILKGKTNSAEWEYTGDILNEKPHGNGRQEYSNGSWFDGEWKDGQFIHGEGMYICESSGNWFLGKFVDSYWASGVLHMHPSEARYEGEFTHRDGRHYRHGNGRIEFPNGDYYEGGWWFDLRHGQGSIFHADSGVLKTGIWIDNVLQ